MKFCRPISLILLLGFLCISALPLTYAQSDAEYKAAGILFQSVNRAREAHGVQPLRLDPALNAAAQQHAQRMADANAISHQFPGEPELLQRVQKQGVALTTVAENVAVGTSAEQLHQEWMHSPLHRANILDPRLNAVGFGIVKQNGQLFAVEDFATELAGLTREQQEQQVATVLVRQGVTLQADPTIARTYCGDTPKRVHPLPRLIMNYTTPNLQLLPQLVKDRIVSSHLRSGAVGACSPNTSGGFTAYHIIILLY
ncbi:MAG TPA: CAP domain-containing protein [Acidobacteriaceae bacterium]|jgi:hypothetical protein|nr:CAP domain-containing protein [Acidobacteriaceae bacterium]